jgi:intracellular septation protein A
MKTAGLLLSLSWRWLFALALLLGAGTLLQHQLLFLDFVSDTRLHPSIFWCCMAGLNALISMIYRPGLMAILWGHRLLTPELWNRINLGTTWFFLAMAVLAFLVGQVASESVWGYFKLHLQPLILLTRPIWAITLET